MAIDYSTPNGQVRLLIADLDDTDRAFEDDAIAAFLTMENDNVRLAAAQALDVIASNEALVLKVMKTIDVETDGAKVATVLYARATELRRQVSAGSDGGGDFEIAEMVVNPFTYRTRLYNEFMREGSGTIIEVD